jgi:hypothetical protein
MAQWYMVEGDSPEEANSAQERLLAAWPDAPLENLEVLDFILESARDDVIAYAPAIPEDTLTVEDGVISTTWVPPKNYVLAQLERAKDIWNDGRVDPATGDIGDGSFTFRPGRMRKSIRVLIRPEDGKPHVL